MLLEEVVVDKAVWDKRASAAKAVRSTRLSVSMRDNTRRKMREYQRRVRQTRMKDYSASAKQARSLSIRTKVRTASGVMAYRKVIWWADAAAVLRLSELTMQRAWVNHKLPRPSCIARNVRGIKKFYLLSEVLSFVDLFKDADLLYLTPNNPIISSLFAVAKMLRDQEGVPQ